MIDLFQDDEFHRFTFGFQVNYYFFSSRDGKHPVHPAVNHIEGDVTDSRGGFRIGQTELRCAEGDSGSGEVAGLGLHQVQQGQQRRAGLRLAGDDRRGVDGEPVGDLRGVGLRTADRGAGFVGPGAEEPSAESSEATATRLAPLVRSSRERSRSRSSPFSRCSCAICSARPSLGGVCSGTRPPTSWGGAVEVDGESPWVRMAPPDPARAPARIEIRMTFFIFFCS